MLVGALRAPSAWAAVLSRGPEPPDHHGTGCGPAVSFAPVCL